VFVASVVGAPPPASHDLALAILTLLPLLPVTPLAAQRSGFNDTLDDVCGCGGMSGRDRRSEGSMAATSGGGGGRGQSSSKGHSTAWGVVSWLR